MAESFTPEQIEQFLQEFFTVVGRRQYVGARYVPMFGRKGESSIEWDGGLAPYEPITVVTHEGMSYTSRTYVPIGIDIHETDYWACTGNYDAQVEQYREEVLAFDGRIDALEDAMPVASFDSTNTVKKYIDDSDSALDTRIDSIEDALPISSFDSTSTVKKYVDDTGDAIEALLPATSFDSTNTVKKYIDDSDDAIKSIIPATSFTSSNTVKKYVDDGLALRAYNKNEIVVLGDSVSCYSYNNGVVSSGAELWTKVAAKTGVTVHNFAVGGAGFLNTNYTPKTMLVQLGEAVADTTIDVNKVRMFIVFAGTNDYSGFNVGQLQDAARNFAATYRASRFSTVPLYICLDQAGYGSFSNADKRRGMIYALSVNGSICTAYDTNWVLKGYPNIATEDNVHPNTTGYNALANYFAALVDGRVPNMYSTYFGNEVIPVTGVGWHYAYVHIKDGILYFDGMIEITPSQLNASANPAIYSIPRVGTGYDTLQNVWIQPINAYHMLPDGYDVFAYPANNGNALEIHLSGSNVDATHTSAKRQKLHAEWML